MADWYNSHRAPAHLAILDGCCGEGGATRGYVQAGHDVWGVDNDPSLEAGYLRSGGTGFICADIMDVLSDTKFLRRFDFIHTSFPCQGYSGMSHCRPGLADTYPRLIGPGRELLEAQDRPWLIENVGLARSFMRDPQTLCMWGHFRRPTYRHRLLEGGNGFTFIAPTAPDDVPGRRNRECGWPHPVPAAKAGHWTPGKFVSVSGHERKEPVREAMEITWMSSREAVKEAIPPYMTFAIGQQLANAR